MNWAGWLQAGVWGIVAGVVVGMLSGVVSALLTQVFARLTFHNRPMACDERWADEKLVQISSGQALVHRCGFSTGHGGHLHVCTCGASRLISEAVRQHEGVADG